MTAKVLWDVVRTAAARTGIRKLAPHDRRRTCARLYYLAGDELDQIQFGSALRDESGVLSAGERGTVAVRS